jgi:hypothetical protein
MKKLIILFLFLSTLMLAQVTSSPSILIKIANSVTVFGTNLSVGTQIYDIANHKLYAVTTKINATETITTAALSLNLLNTAGHSSVDDSTTSSTTSTTDLVIPKMTRTIVEDGTYSIQFNGQIEIPTAIYTTGFSTATAAEDLNLIYNDINKIFKAFLFLVGIAVLQHLRKSNLFKLSMIILL